jgi:hypothetical protein
MNHCRLFEGVSTFIEDFYGGVIGGQNCLQKHNMKYMIFSGRCLGIGNLNFNLIIRFLMIRSMPVRWRINQPIVVGFRQSAGKKSLA